MLVPDRTFEQKRAGHALGEIKKLKSKGKDHYGHFHSYVSSLPASIVMNGLGQAMAFELSGGKEHKILYDILQDWLCGESRVFTDEDDLMKAITGNGQHEYIRAQTEGLAYLEWLKKLQKMTNQGL